MNEINLKYLNENFLSLDELAEESGIQKETIKSYIKEKLIPNASYELRQTSRISSPLGDNHIVEDTILYFPKSYVDLVKRIRNNDPEEMKQVFIEKMKRHLLDHQEKEFAYKNAVSIPDSLDEELEKEWNHYLNGIYGICTLNATPEEIIEKEVAVKKLISFLETCENRGEIKSKESELRQIISEYDQVSSLFAPYQRESSSRGKYVDKPLQKLGLEDKIRSY